MQKSLRALPYNSTMDRDTLNKINQARKLYEDGYSQKDIAQTMGVSEATVSGWKTKAEDLGGAWQVKADASKYIIVPTELETLIQHVLKKYKDNTLEHSERMEVLDELDALVSIRKKYEGANDKYGETIRVMGRFGSYVRDNHGESTALIRDIIGGFVRSVPRE